MAKRDLTGAVDFAQLEHVTGGDSALMEEVLGLFREQAEIWIRLLDPQAEHGAWRDAAHSLKGSALAIGAVALAERCGAAEMADGADVGQRTVLLGHVRTELDAALADIAAWTHEEALRSLKG